MTKQTIYTKTRPSLSFGRGFSSYKIVLSAKSINGFNTSLKTT